MTFFSYYVGHRRKDGAHIFRSVDIHESGDYSYDHNNGTSKIRKEGKLPKSMFESVKKLVEQSKMASMEDDLWPRENKEHGRMEVTVWPKGGIANVDLVMRAFGSTADIDALSSADLSEMDKDLSSDKRIQVLRQVKAELKTVYQTCQRVLHLAEAYALHGRVAV